MGNGRSTRRPPDPQRRQRIAEAAIRVVAARGVGDLTHRAVATEADVPLGSTTYYFKTREQLLAAAMEHEVARFQADVDDWARTLTRETLIPRFARLLIPGADPINSQERLLVGYELYLAALRLEELRPISARWDAVLGAEVAKYLPPTPTRLLCATFTGLQVASLVSGRPIEQAEAERLLALSIAGCADA